MSQKKVGSQGINDPYFNRNKWYFGKIAPISNSKLDWTVKGVVAGISEEFIRMGIPHDRLTKVWYQNIADAAGLSMDAVVVGISKLEKLNAIIKETKQEKNNQGIKVPRVYICFTPAFLNDPREIFKNAVVSNRGGKRIKRHKDCGGEIVNLCTGCGQTHIAESDIYYEELEEKEQEPQGNDIDLAELDKRVDEIEAISFHDMPKDGRIADQAEVEAFKRTMEVARRQPRKLKHSLNKTIYTDKKGMEF